jgi:hypothetical protein
MVEPAVTGSGASLFVTTRSATVVTDTVVVVVALLFVVFASGSVVVAVAVLLMIVPFAVAAPTWTTIWNVADVAGPSNASVQLTVPVPPTGGLAHRNAGPAVCASETNDVFAGTASLKETLFAPAVPLFVTVIVYVMLEPATTGSGLSLFVTARSGPATTVETDALLLAPFASADAELPVAVLVIVAPAPAFTATTMSNVDVAPAPSVAIEQEIVPVPPAAGVVQPNAGPLVWVSETNVVPVGTTSVRVTVCASLVPMFEMLTL